MPALPGTTDSEAPSYHSTLSAERHGERPPSYTPSTAPPYSRPRTSSSAPRPAPEASTASIATHSTFSRGAGLPRIPDPFPRNRGPDLNQFRVGTWSSVHRNPNARHYQAVANRRVSAANSSSSNSSVEALRGMLDRLNEEEEQRATARVRPLEDPHLVGEDAATRARSQRLARESGDEILIREVVVSEIAEVELLFASESRTHCSADRKVEPMTPRVVEQILLPEWPSVEAIRRWT